MTSKLYETAAGPHRVFSALPGCTGGHALDADLFKPCGQSELTPDFKVLFELAQPLDATHRIPCGGTRSLDPLIGGDDPTILVDSVYREGAW